MTVKKNWIAGLFGIAAFFYIFLNGIFRIENIDDAWFLSFAHQYLTRNVFDDAVFGATPQTGSTGHLFGIFCFHAYGLWLDWLGWTKASAHLLSTLFLFAASVLWYFTLKKVKGITPAVAGVFCWLLIFMEPYFYAAHSARPDALVFFLSSLSLFLASRGFWGTGMFVAACGFETHAMGGIAFFWLAVWWWTQGRPRKAAGPAVLGLAAGGLLYIGLHGAYLSIWATLFDAQEKIGRLVFGGILRSYFIETRYYRHVLEWLPFAGLLTRCCMKKSWPANFFAGHLLVGSLLIGFFSPRANFHYMIYIYPGLLLWLLLAARRHRRIHWVAGFFLVYFSLQYLAVGWLNYGFDMKEYETKLRESTALCGEIPVVGGPNAWFVMKEKEFIHYRPALKVSPVRACLVTGHDYAQPERSRVRTFFEENYRLRLQHQFQVGPDLTKVYLIEKK